MNSYQHLPDRDRPCGEEGEATRVVPRILRLKSVMKRTGMGRSWIYASMKSGVFVPCIKIGRATGWDAAAVDAWILAQISRSEFQANASR